MDWYLYFARTSGASTWQFVMSGGVPSDRESFSVLSGRIFLETWYPVYTFLVYFVPADGRPLPDFLNLSDLFSSIVYVT